MTNKRTNRLKANRLFMWLMTLLMAAAVVFGGAGIMNASAKRLPFVHFSATINLIYNRTLLQFPYNCMFPTTTAYNQNFHYLFSS